MSDADPTLCQPSAVPVQVNGRGCTLIGPISIAELLAEGRLSAAQVAVEINEQLVPRSMFATRRLQAGDRIEIVTLAGGG